jgi:hypothetical protein
MFSGKSMKKKPEKKFWLAVWGSIFPDGMNSGIPPETLFGG